ncbi:MAG: NnrS family protein [Candidatus Caldatribacteriota bacterium]
MKEAPLILSEPYRLFFPLGILTLMCGILLWVPLLWDPGVYPVLTHRYLVINGFAGLFIGGFLMTAVPRFSKTFTARTHELVAYLVVTLIGLIFSHLDNETMTFLFSGFQPIILLYFLLSRIFKRKENPPYSFVFIFIGLILWAFSAFASAFWDNEAFRHLHHEGAIAAVILGVGGRLIPGILGHVEIVKAQREKYERPVSILSSVPWHFWPIIFFFILSYFLEERAGAWVRLASVLVVALKYWRLYLAPKDKTALTWCIWTSAWLITLSFVLKGVWSDGLIHASHSFFINGIVLLSLLIGTRVVQSHGPKDKNLENLKILYFITFLVVFSAATRVSAFIMPETYLNHLAYSSIVLMLALIIWSIKYLKYVVRQR